MKINESLIFNKYYLKLLFCIYFSIVLIKSLINPKLFSIARYKHYINDCRNFKKYKRTEIKNDIPYFSICLPAFNMENYIKKVVLSILNQSFQDFEIIIVNDNSKDKTEFIIKEILSKDKRIKSINHLKNSGVYTSRVDAFLISKGKYILLMDPDDMILNPKLLEELYNYNIKNNLDIIEFRTLCSTEKYLNLRIRQFKYHDHNLEGIIFQPKLSEIFFYHPLYKNYSEVQCRNIWNKIIRREVLLETFKYIGKDYYNKFFITAEDTIINLISLHFEKNFTNVNFPGYMYNIREKSMTHGKSNTKKKILFNYNHLLYLKKFYIYLKDFNKNRNFLFYELIKINKLLFELNNITNKYNEDIKIFFKDILEDQNSSELFKNYIKNLTNFLHL